MFLCMEKIYGLLDLLDWSSIWLGSPIRNNIRWNGSILSTCLSFIKYI